MPLSISESMKMIAEIFFPLTCLATGEKDKPPKRITQNKETPARRSVCTKEHRLKLGTSLQNLLISQADGLEETEC